MEEQQAVVDLEAHMTRKVTLEAASEPSEVR